MYNEFCPLCGYLGTRLFTSFDCSNVECQNNKNVVFISKPCPWFTPLSATLTGFTFGCIYPLRKHGSEYRIYDDNLEVAYKTHTQPLYDNFLFSIFRHTEVQHGNSEFLVLESEMGDIEVGQRLPIVDIDFDDDGYIARYTKHNCYFPLSQVEQFSYLDTDPKMEKCFLLRIVKKS